MEEFQMSDDDEVAASIAKYIMRHCLTIEGLSPRDIIGLGNGLFALERLPASTPGASVSVTISRRAGPPGATELAYFTFSITEDEFAIGVGGCINDPAIGGDSFSSPGWRFGTDGEREKECDIHALDGRLGEELQMGVEVDVEDESEIDYG